MSVFLAAGAAAERASSFVAGNSSAGWEPPLLFLVGAGALAVWTVAALLVAGRLRRGTTGDLTALEARVEQLEERSHG